MDRTKLYVRGYYINDKPHSENYRGICVYNKLMFYILTPKEYEMVKDDELFNKLAGFYRDRPYSNNTIGYTVDTRKS